MKNVQNLNASISERNIQTCPSDFEKIFNVYKSVHRAKSDALQYGRKMFKMQLVWYFRFDVQMIIFTIF